MKFQVREVPDPILGTRSEEVEEFNTFLVGLCQDLALAMYQQSGIGLAAPQIGVLSRIAVVHVDLENDLKTSSRQEGQLITLVNPKIVFREGRGMYQERCLSVPGLHVQVCRSRQITVEAKDATGGPLLLHASGFPSSVIQHEIEHLDGVTILDHAPPAKRRTYLRRLRRNR